MVHGYETKVSRNDDDKKQQSPILTDNQSERQQIRVQLFILWANYI